MSTFYLFYEVDYQSMKNITRCEISLFINYHKFIRKDIPLNNFCISSCVKMVFVSRNVQFHYNIQICKQKKKRNSSPQAENQLAQNLIMLILYLKR